MSSSRECDGIGLGCKEAPYHRQYALDDVVQEKPSRRIFALTMLRRYAEKRRRRDDQIIEAASRMGATAEGIAAVLEMTIRDVDRALERSRVARESAPLLTELLTVDKERERRLQRLAASKGLKLRKSAQRRRDDPDYGLYELIEAGMTRSTGDIPERLVVEATTLDAIEEYLDIA